MNKKIKTPNRLLVVATRQIGDVLLITPLLSSLRKSYPNAVIDVLGYTNKCVALEGNSDINTVFEITEKPSFSEIRILIKQIYRKYDVAITTLTGDKPHFYAWLAAKHRIGFIHSVSKQTALKRALCQQWVLFDDLNTHTVLENLRLAKCLDIPAIPIVSLPKPKKTLAQQNKEYAIIHPSPMWTYKQWTEQGWIAVIKHLLSKNLKVIISGGTDPNEKAVCEKLASTFPNEDVESIAGKVKISELSELLKQATCYVGIDTSITHMAAASGCPTVAIFGPSNVIKWGPWPSQYVELSNPYVKKHYPWQQVNNVLIIQGKEYPCVPCYQEGCDKHKKSHSKCLQNLDNKAVLAAIDIMINNTSIN